MNEIISPQPGERRVFLRQPTGQGWPAQAPAGPKIKDRYLPRQTATTFEKKEGIDSILQLLKSNFSQKEKPS